MPTSFSANLILLNKHWLIFTVLSLKHSAQKICNKLVYAAAEECKILISESYSVQCTVVILNGLKPVSWRKVHVRKKKCDRFRWSVTLAKPLILLKVVQWSTWCGPFNDCCFTENSDKV